MVDRTVNNSNTRSRRQQRNRMRIQNIVFLDNMQVFHLDRNGNLILNNNHNQNGH